jgi:exodeoxyribonuclease-3
VITVATWNVNSVKSRLQHLLDWLRADKPDIVLLQELKCINEAFPAMEIEELGYNIAVHGQKTYNGVAILSKFPLDDITRGLPEANGDDHARYIEAVVNLPGKAMRVASVYIPNGQTATSEKFPYKLRFLDRLHMHMQTLLSYDEMLVVGGDYNIAPNDDDVHHAELWHGSVLTHDEVRARFRKIAGLGMYDAYRLINAGKNPCEYTWWDYRAGGFAKDNGLRIDHLLISSSAADKLTGCYVKKDLRALEKASDHAPVVGVFSI